jgi:hypothetical protein
MVAEASAKGINPDGSMIHEANLDTGHVDDDLHWWVQAENVVGWMNIYQDGRANVPYGGNLHDTKEIALKKRSKNAIATVKIEWEE